MDRLRRFGAPALAAGLVVATCLTLSSGPYGRNTVIDRGASIDAANSFAKDKGGPLCVGWPAALVPSAPAPRAEGSIRVGASGRHFALTNNTGAPAEVTVTVTDGKIQPVDDSEGSPQRQAGNTAVLYSLGQGVQVEFDITCPTTSLTVESPGVTIENAIGEIAESPYLVKNTRPNP